MKGEGKKEKRGFEISMRMSGKYFVPRRRGIVRAITGNTLTVGSDALTLGGLNEPLARGARVELALEWPVFLDERVPMKLVIWGIVCAIREDRAAIHIMCYEFRTRAMGNGVAATVSSSAA